MSLPNSRAYLQNKIVGQQQDIGPALAQRRQIDRKYIEPVKKILAKGALGDLGFEVLVGSGYNPDVHFYGPGGAKRLEFPFLQNAQKLCLGDRRKLPHFVEEDAAALGLFESSRAAALSRPVNAPFSWPNSSLSRSVSGIAAQLTWTIGPPPCGCFRVLPWPPVPFPVPVSPVMSTVVFVSATWSIRRRTSWITFDRPIILVVGRLASASIRLRRLFSSSTARK